MTPPPRRLATVAVRAGRESDPSHGSVAPPMVPASTFVHGNAGGYEYGRERNPTWARLESAMSALEDAAGTVVFSSGMAAITAVVQQVPFGGRVVAASNGYSGTRNLLRSLTRQERLHLALVDIADTEAVARACTGGADLVCLEAITNPMLTVPDLRTCIELASGAGAVTMVDSTFATPVLLQPLALGADIVVHSLTKYAGGHSDLILGCVAANDIHVLDRLRETRTTTGSIPGQLESWLCLRGLASLEVRMQRHMSNAAELARRLETHPLVQRVHYPGLPSHPQHERARALFSGGFGGMVSIEPAGDAARAEALCERTELWTHTTSLGAVESTIERRARYTVDAEVCPPGLLRLSVGLEDVEDLWSDLQSALEATAD